MWVTSRLAQLAQAGRPATDDSEAFTAGIRKRENLGSFEVKLTPEILAEIAALHELQPNPAP
ncbi:hypothetical protein Bsp3421_004394 [Burkholderia sp. FERM BP-3421]|jgi:hypothetical protein|uniref:hypothetical protein n=1 Tax=Burkholderia sp. FERM BP-3421 TaxID=1494466 RepID=UPI002360A5EF|nr:hypothetical protein [Burkholderia sp. FERM BP-3421]WDD94280.1 hypothetical protein Bsp3421_004394 [Burkholderia sp. FERM BP-3421]